MPDASRKMLVATNLQTLRFLLWLNYRSPYIRLADRLWKITGEEEDDAPLPNVAPWRDRLATSLERRDYKWRERHLRERTMPYRIWKARS